MPSRKKPRPLFEVPVEIGAGRESGWVYRSEPEDYRREDDEPAYRPVDRSTGSMSANPLALAMSALAQTFVLGVTIAAIPLSVGFATLQSLCGSPASTERRE